MTFALQRYLVSSSLLFGTIGLVHGLCLYKVQEVGVSQQVDKQTREKRMIRYIAGGALYGLFLGPWAPIAGPIWVFKKWPDSQCSHLKM